MESLAGAAQEALTALTGVSLVGALALRMHGALRAERDDLALRLATAVAAVRSARDEVDRERRARHQAEAALHDAEDLFSKAFLANPSLLTISTLREGRLMEVNDTFLRATGHRREDVVGRTGREIGLWADPEERDRLVGILRAEGCLRSREFAYRTRAGDTRLALVSAEIVQVGNESAVLSTAIDITERKQAERALRANEERYALAARGANDGLWDWDLLKGEIYFSPRWNEMIGHADGEMARDPREWFSRVHPEDREALGMQIVAHLEGITILFQNEHRVRHRDGTDRWMLCRGLAVRDEFDKAYRFAGSQTDITERRAVEERLIHDAFHDGLTGLPNRALFMDRLGRAVELAQRNPARRFAVLFVDLDRFKVVNDSLGHSVGDELLGAVARRLQECVRPADTVGRLGGDEFGILVEEAQDASDATRAATRIVDALGLPFEVGGHDVFSAVSIGIAVSATGYDRPEEILRDADTALYRAKARGRGRYEVFDQTMHHKAVALLELETDLRKALDRGELSLRYQPIVSIETGRLAAFEALVRWRHPTRGLVMPCEFVGIAEETGLILPLGDLVLLEACRQVRQWEDGEVGRLPLVSINVSSRQFMQPDLVERIGRILSDAGVAGSRISLEITESVIMESPEGAAEMIRRLKELGIRISVDDFGTGYSCLSLLHTFPIDTLKIDRSFVSRMGAGGEGGETVRTIVSLAHNLGLEVVAEGVETAEQLAALRRLRCAYAQGYLFSEPVEAADAGEWISSGRRW